MACLNQIQQMPFYWEKNYLPAEKYLFCRWSWKYPGSLSEYNCTGKVTQPTQYFFCYAKL